MFRVNQMNLSSVGGEKNMTQDGNGYPDCPQCGGKPAEIVYGLIDPPPLSVAPGLIRVLNPAAALRAATRSVEEWENDPLWKRVRAGEVILGGCVVSPTKWVCRKCGHEWPEGIEA